jgi:hypothetical protein
VPTLGYHIYFGYANTNQGTVINNGSFYVGAPTPGSTANANGNINFYLYPVLNNYGTISTYYGTSDTNRFTIYSNSNIYGTTLAPSSMDGGVVWQATSTANLFGTTNGLGNVNGAVMLGANSTLNTVYGSIFDPLSTINTATTGVYGLTVNQGAYAFEYGVIGDVRPIAYLTVNGSSNAVLKKSMTVHDRPHD